MTVRFRLGPPGRLQTIPMPGRGIEATRARVGPLARNGAGGAAAATLGRRRSYQLEWGWLPAADYAVLDALEQRLYGQGPYILLDPAPARRNLLQPNQAAAGTTRRDTSDWSATAGTVGVAAAGAYTSWAQLERQITWLLPASQASAVQLRLDDTATTTTCTAARAAGVVPARQHSFAARVRLAAAGTLSVAARVSWYDAAAAAVGTAVTGTAVALSTTPQQVAVAAAAAPAGAAYGVASLVTTTTAPATPATVVVDAPQLERAAAPSLWVPGSGTPRVVVDQLTDAYPLLGIHAVTLTLAEV